MELNQGFKQTEFGVIPHDWKELNLGKSAILKARIGWQGLTTAEYLKTGDYYLITGTDFKNGYIDWDNCVYVERLRYDQDKNIQVKIDDILVTKDGTIGKVAYVDKLPMKTTLNSGVFVIRPINNSYYPRYFYFVLRSRHFDEFLGKLTAGSTISHLYQKDFVNYDFPLPPTLEEQKAIATALTDVDNLITNLDGLIVKKKAIKQGAMQQLLTPPHKGGKRLDGFDGEWGQKTIKELAKTFTKQTGFDYSSHIKPTLISKKKRGYIPFIQNKDFQSHYVNFDTDYYIPEDVAIRFPMILLNERCLMISISGSIGKVGVFNNKRIAFIGGAVSVGKFHNPEYLDWVMNYLQSEAGQHRMLKDVKAGSHQNLILDDIRKMIIPMPSLEEQKAINKILRDFESDIETLETKKEKYLDLKQGMMQELLTGKTRLV